MPRLEIKVVLVLARNWLAYIETKETSCVMAVVECGRRVKKIVGLSLRSIYTADKCSRQAVVLLTRPGLLELFQVVALDSDAASWS